MRRPVLVAVILLLLVVGAAIVDVWPRVRRSQMPERFGFGTPATADDIRRSDTDVTPDGRGLPHDSGTVAQGESIYRLRCSGCHGVTGTEGPFDHLVGREPGDSFNFGRDPNFLAKRTIGNYWPYATTLYDYINRAMPFDAPGSLSSREVYSVVAYLLYRNQIVSGNAVISDRTLPLVRMPARDRFVVDNRSGGRTIR
ncbi:MAG TPA: cytochrome c [Gemmatimonadaceae bacterium]|jgi:cytochrome c